MIELQSKRNKTTEVKYKNLNNIAHPAQHVTNARTALKGKKIQANGWALFTLIISMTRVWSDYWIWLNKPTAIFCLRSRISRLACSSLIGFSPNILYSFELYWCVADHIAFDGSINAANTSQRAPQRSPWPRRRCFFGMFWDWKH